MNNLRSCCVSKIKKDKSNFFRVVRLPNGEIKIDLTQSLFGRGAYVSKDKKIIELAKAKKSLSKALRCKVNENVYDELLSLL